LLPVLVKLQGTAYLSSWAYTYSEEMEKEQIKLGTKAKIRLETPVEGIYFQGRIIQTTFHGDCLQRLKH